MKQRQLWMIIGVVLRRSGAGTGAGQGTFPDGLNIEGALIGMSFDANNAVHGFLRTPW